MRPYPSCFTSVFLVGYRKPWETDSPGGTVVGQKQDTGIRGKTNFVWCLVCWSDFPTSQKNLSTFKHLKILSLQSNRITKMENLEELESLEELYLSHNGLSKIEGLEKNVREGLPATKMEILTSICSSNWRRWMSGTIKSARLRISLTWKTWKSSGWVHIAFTFPGSWWSPWLGKR